MQPAHAGEAAFEFRNDPAAGAGDVQPLEIEQRPRDEVREARAAELLDGTKLKDVEYRKQLAAGGRKALDDANDPMIDLARIIDKDARAVRKRYEDEVVAVERANYAKVARALFEQQGTKLYPDATFTLRLSYGAVKGYTENGKQVLPFTTLGGLYARSNQFHDAFPYNLPSRWVSKQKAINPKIEMADVREMIIQHVLTEDIFMRVFDEAEFHRESKTNRPRTDDEHIRSCNYLLTGAVRRRILGFRHDDLPQVPGCFPN